MSPNPILRGIPVSRSLVFCALLWRSVFVRFILAVVLSVLLRLTYSDYPFW